MPEPDATRKLALAKGRQTRHRAAEAAANIPRAKVYHVIICSRCGRLNQDQLWAEFSHLI